MFESTVSYSPPPTPGVEWTAITTRPGVAERMAARSFRIARERPEPWWAFGLVCVPLFALYALTAWLRDETILLTFPVVLFVAFAFMSWQRKGFCDLLERYEAELSARTPR